MRSVYNKNLFPIVPSSYIELSQFISRYLEEKDTSMLIDVSWDQFRKWGNLCGLQDDDVIGAAQFLHDTGINKKIGGKIHSQVLLFIFTM